MLYLTLKQIHVACAALSVLGFGLRGIGWIGRRAWVERRWVKVAPHLVDTLFLASGVALAVLARFDPLEQPWLAAKLIGLVVYVLLGMSASRAADARVRAGAWLAALAVFAYLLSVALSKSPLGFLVWL